MPKLTTSISQAFWCNPRRGRDPFEPAVVPSMSASDGEAIAWLDKLLDDGIAMPEQRAEGRRALTLLVTGPPGSGKSTLAMELCYRWAKDHDKRSLYITSESDDHWIVEKAKSYGWKDVEHIFVGTARKGRRGPAPVPLVTIWKTTDFHRYFKFEAQLPELAKGILQTLTSLLPVSVDPEPLHKAWEGLQDHELQKKVKVEEAHLLVIDSLNTVEATKRGELFEKFVKIASTGPELLVIIAESGGSGGEVEFWEYVSDLVIRLDRRYISDYMMRTLEVVKARQQAHVWGVHQLKIYQPSPTARRKPEELRRAHPYREEGGIFIFPSIHYYLSVYKRLQPNVHQGSVATPIENLTRILGQGFPKGRCTGFIGCRGGHKSHLGYLHLLSRIVGDERERGIVVSLRDDEGMARKTMEKILKHELGYKGSLEKLETDDRLEILFYPPGYITPEEFFHRMFMSIHRLKRGGASGMTLLFNSLDQLSSRFPLCARQQIFIPGIIEMLTAEEVTSIFIAVEEQGQPPEQYGLLSMADALLSFQQEKFSKRTYCGHVSESHQETQELSVAERQAAEDKLGEHRQSVVLRVVRFAGGQAAGAGGLLELIEETDDAFDIYGGKTGLQFTPFSAKYAESEAS